MISTVYNKLLHIAQQQFPEIVIGSKIFFSAAGRARKLRIYLFDDSYVDIWISVDGKRYSYQWIIPDRPEFLYRHDNAPHDIRRDVADFLRDLTDFTSNLFSVTANGYISTEGNEVKNGLRESGADYKQVSRKGAKRRRVFGRGLPSGLEVAPSGAKLKMANCHEKCQPMESTAKVFQNGRSQAVRLPKAFRFKGKEVKIRKEGDKVILEPLERDRWPGVSGIISL